MSTDINILYLNWDNKKVADPMFFTQGKPISVNCKGEVLSYKG